MLTPADFRDLCRRHYLAATCRRRAIMGMNNVYYRFQHVTGNQNYRSMSARLRMNIIRSHGVEAADFELWCAAVSAINGCSACVDSHEKVVREKGLSEEAVLAANRLARWCMRSQPYLTRRESAQPKPSPLKSVSCRTQFRLAAFETKQTGGLGIGRLLRCRPDSCQAP
jgi:AhpD family alkylhydroperoxidase